MNVLVKLTGSHPFFSFPHPGVISMQLIKDKAEVEVEVYSSSLHLITIRFMRLCGLM